MKHKEKTLDKISFIPALTISLLVFNSFLYVQAQTNIKESNSQQILESYGKLPLVFELNQGQTDNHVKFLSRGNGFSLFLTSNEAVLSLKNPVSSITTNTGGTQVTAGVLCMKLIGANTEAQMTGLEELPGKSNYYIGNDPQKWYSSVPNYAKVHYEGIYPGIDLIYYGNQRQLEYDFVVAPGADPNNILLGFDGADKIEVDGKGDLVIHFTTEQTRMLKPFIYQEVDGVRQEIDGNYVLKGKQLVGFDVAEYDAVEPLIIDPVLTYASYLGGAGLDVGYGIAVDIMFFTPQLRQFPV